MRIFIIHKYALSYNLNYTNLSVNNKRVYFDVTQTTFTNVDIKDKDGAIIKQFEAGERG